MTQDEIIEGNKLLTMFELPDDEFTYTEKGWGNSVLYHKSWDWLMCVVEKIESLGYDFIISNTNVGVWRKGDFKMINESDNKANTKIEAAYTACVNFIKWYNTQKQPA